ncbi:Protein pelota-like protein [Smittium mucronatum]|uniref:Protein DOM34 homolog n=1 Tax=Smittium mucronatum TaxID=133383 RepID=A0A1R0H1C9_9FUNG|nr:Protein pelota-like protein [Smittium mucronatum]
MKLLGKHLEKDRSGRIRLQAEDAEDMWHVYNLILKGDKLEASTIRGVKSESSTGSVSSERAGALRVNGKSTELNKYVQLGQFHTLDLELNQPFAIVKDYWDSISLDRIANACDITKQADVAAVVMQEGLANICLLTQYMTIVRQRIEVPIPKKRKGSTTTYDKSVKNFFDKVYNAILVHVDFQVVKAVIIGSPGFTKDQFMDHLWATAVRTDEKKLLENRKKFVVIHTSSGHKSALEEVMRDPTIKAKLSDTKASNEVVALDNFYQMMNKDPNRAFYGYKHVARAVQSGAVGTLLITDELFRNQDINKRKQYIRLVENVKKSRANVVIFSSLHVSGEQLNQLTGVAAILNFPLPDIDSDFESD